LGGGPRRQPPSKSSPNREQLGADHGACIDDAQPGLVTWLNEGRPIRRQRGYDYRMGSTPATRAAGLWWRDSPDRSSGCVGASGPRDFVHSNPRLGALIRRQAAVADRGSGSGSRFLEGATYDDQSKRRDDTRDVAIFDLIDLDDVLIQRTYLLYLSTPAVLP
jgi:hypothetical protein